MICRQVLLAAVLLGLASCATPAPPEEAAGPADDEPAPITLPTASEESDPDSLNRHLAYAQTLVETKDDAGCASRLDQVQAQIDLVAASPILDIVLPDGRARLANIAYRLHVERAYCGNAVPQRNELLTALDIAQKAIPLYRDLHDYKSVVVMQYDVAATWRMLNDKDKSALVLEAAIAMDGEYGFASDAAENSALLGTWQNRPAAPPDLSKRSITLKFAWHPLDADMSLRADYYDVVGGTVVHSSGKGLQLRHVRPEGDDWILSHDRLERRYEFGEWKTKPSSAQARDTALLVIGEMLPPDLRISDKGEFRHVVDPDGLAGIEGGDMDTLDHDIPAEDGAGKIALPANLGSTVRLFAKPHGIEAKAAEDHSLVVSAWVDATLEQGVWYEMTANLFVPGLALGVRHDIAFSYSRPVPCGDGAAAASCAEILVHATPDPDAQADEMKDLARLLRIKAEKGIQFDAATDLRLVVDPATLLPQTVEKRRHWYLAIQGMGDPVIGSEKSVATYTYR